MSEIFYHGIGYEFVRADSDHLNHLSHLRENLSSDTQDMQLCSADQALPGDDAIVVRFCFGESTTQLQLTRQQCTNLTVSAMADIWKACSNT